MLAFVFNLQGVNGFCFMLKRVREKRKRGRDGEGKYKKKGDGWVKKNGLQ